MKRINSLKIITTILAFAAFGMVLKSCKKVDNVGKIPTTVKEIEAAKAAAIKSIKEQYGDISAGIVIPVNKTADEYFYKDNTGKMVSLYGTVANPTPGGPDVGGPPPIGCNYTCNNTTNPANLRIVAKFTSAQRFYTCETSSNPDPNERKSTVTGEWTVSVPFLLNPFTSSLSTGVLKFVNAGGGTIATFQAYAQTSTNLTSLKIEYVGADPACPAVSKLYKVTYKFGDLPNSYFAAGNSMRSSLSLANDCSLINYQLNTNEFTASTFGTDAYLPCNRIDKVFISPGSVPVLALGNATAICTYPAGWLPIDYHQLEYRQVVSATGSLNWNDQFNANNVYSAVYWSKPFNGGGIPKPEFTPNNYSTLDLIASGSGLWLVRYRNVKNGACNIINPFPNGPTGGNWGVAASWVTEVYSF